MFERKQVIAIQHVQWIGRTDTAARQKDDPVDTLPAVRRTCRQRVERAADRRWVEQRVYCSEAGTVLFIMKPVLVIFLSLYFKLGSALTETLKFEHIFVDLPGQFFQASTLTCLAALTRSRKARNAHTESLYVEGD